MDAGTSRHLADGKACLEAALFYQSLGWSVLADCPGDHVGVGREHGKICQQPGKVPLHRWKDCQDVAATVQEIREWWHRWPNANVGMALGPVSGIIRIDIDGPGGEQRLIELSKGIVPATLEFTSGRINVGRGLLYAIPAGVRLKTTYEQPGKHEELRFQAKGAQTVLPPSRHVSGAYYVWQNDPREMKAHEAPDWLVAQLIEKHNGTTDFNPKDWEKLFAGVEEGQRNSTMAAVIGKLAYNAVNLDDESVIWSAKSVNERHDPPLSDIEFQTVFASIIRKEKLRRAEEDEKKLFDHIEKQIDESVKEPANGVPKVNGHVVDTFKTDEPWRVVVRDSEPPEYFLRSPYWSEQESLEAQHGFIRLQPPQILRWGGIAIEALKQGNVAIPVKLKGWNVLFNKLLKVAPHITSQTESKRVLLVMENVLSQLRTARDITNRDDGTPNYGYGSPKRLPDGNTIVKATWMHTKLKLDIDKLNIRELTDVMRATGMTKLVLLHQRWWSASPQVLTEIWDKVSSDVTVTETQG